MLKHRRLSDEYRFPGFRPSTTVQGVFGDSSARLIALHRRSKKRTAVHVVVPIVRGTIARSGMSAISVAVVGASIWLWRFDVLRVEPVAR